nr:hypothetical protein [Tanacetum cinerariifolium]
QEAVDIMQALKESKKSNKRQPYTKGSDEGTGSIPEVLDESIVISATLSEGTSIKPGVPDKEKDITEEKDSADADVSSLMDIPIQQETPHTQVTKLEKDVSELKNIDHSTEAFVLKYQVLTVVDSYLDSKVRDVFQKELQKHMADLIHKYSLQHLLELTKKPTLTTEQESKKSPADILKIKNEQAERQRSYRLPSSLLTRRLSKTLIEDENAMDKGVVDTVKDHKRKHDDDDDDDDDDEGPSAGLNQGKHTKRRRTKEFESSK